MSRKRSTELDYVTAARAMRETFAGARSVDLSAHDWAVLSVVVELTASWSKLSDVTYLPRIAAIARGREPGADVTRTELRVTRTSLKKLRDLGIIHTKAPGRGRPGVGGPPSYEVALDDPARGHLDEKMTPSGRENDPADARKCPPQGDPTGDRTGNSTGEKETVPDDEPVDRDQQVLSLDELRDAIADYATVWPVEKRRVDAEAELTKLTDAGYDLTAITDAFASYDGRKRKYATDVVDRIRDQLRNRSRESGFEPDCSRCQDKGYVEDKNGDLITCPGCEENRRVA